MGWKMLNQEEMIFWVNQRERNIIGKVKNQLGGKYESGGCFKKKVFIIIKKGSRLGQAETLGCTHEIH